MSTSERSWGEAKGAAVRLIKQKMRTLFCAAQIGLSKQRNHAMSSLPFGFLSNQTLKNKLKNTIWGVVRTHRAQRITPLTGAIWILPIHSKFSGQRHACPLLLQHTSLASVAFCSPAKSLTFSGVMENSLVGKKLKS